MIHSNETISPNQVARHYDELDMLYRKVWGEHVHHGWFHTGEESKEEAVLALTKEVARLSDIRPGDSVCDIGCGYGATSRYLSEHFKVSVLGVTISQAQLSVAQSFPTPHNLDFRLLDWLENDLKHNSFDHLIAIESSEHMPDKGRFFSEAQRVLKPDGTFVVCVWLASENPASWEARYLLEPICREGRLPSMGTESEYLQLFEQNGFIVQSFVDISKFVKRTWTVSLLGLAEHFLSHPRDLKLLMSRFNSNAEFLKTLFRIRIAYETGAMRYGVFKAIKVVQDRDHT